MRSSSIFQLQHEVFMNGYIRIGGDFSQVYDSETMKALLNTNDTIGAVLRIHFCCEHIIDIWCNKVTSNEDFFGFGRTYFSMKVSIAKKLGLPAEIAAFLKNLNNLRNDFAHQTNFVISNQKLDDMRHLVDQIPSYGSQPIPKINDPSWEGLFDDRKLFWSMNDITTIERLVLIYYTFSIKTLIIFNKEFSERGISFSYSD